MLKLLIIFIILTFAEAGQKSKGFTKSKKGCKCWWDLEGVLIDPDTNKPYSCACCYPGGKQCGYPMHNWCTSAKSKTGCRRMYLLFNTQGGISLHISSIV